MKTKNQRGISAIVVLGVIAVLLTIVIPLVSRTIIDLRISRQQEEQARAFSVAETGLERALIGDPAGASGTVTVGGSDVEYTVSSSILGGSGGGSYYIYPKNIGQDTPATIWLVSHSDVGGDFDPDAPWTSTVVPIFEGDSLTVYWGTEKAYASVSEVPALEATLVYQDLDNLYKVKRYLFDPATQFGFSRTDAGGFELPTAGGTLGSGDDETDFRWTSELTGMGCGAASMTESVTCFLLRLRILYAPDDIHPVGVDFTGETLPRQGECFDSLATVVDSGISSRIQRCLLYRDFPPVFDFAMYSGGDLSKE